jgi:hypothetical protein
MQWKSKFRALVVLAAAASGIARTCKTIPEDASWPSDSVWSTFNSSVGGRLIKTIPIGSPCFTGPLFDAAKCQNIKDNWQNPDI